MADTLTVVELTFGNMTLIELAYTADGASLDKSVVVEHCCGILAGVEFIGTAGLLPDANWDFTLLDENAQDVLRTLGGNTSATYEFFQVEQPTSLHQYPVCTSSLNFVASNLGGDASAGTLRLYLR